ncbi:MAG: ArsR family transcriptional regulator [Luteolibacter sp.]
MKLTLLADLLGSTAAEAALLHLFHHGESYGRAVSADFEVSLDSVQKQLDKLERLGILLSKWQGRTLVYTWNPKSRAANRLKDLVSVAYDSLAPEISEVKFAVRRRHRAKDKPIIYSKD